VTKAPILAGVSECAEYSADIVQGKFLLISDWSFIEILRLLLLAKSCGGMAWVPPTTNFIDCGAESQIVSVVRPMRSE
jgi:hypothetical protein